MTDVAVSKNEVTPFPKKGKEPKAVAPRTAAEKATKEPKAPKPPKEAKPPKAEVQIPPLSADEKVALRTFEKVIDKGVQAIWDTAKALAEIRERKLFRGEFKTFEEYTEAKWQISASRARQIIGAAGVRLQLQESVTNVTVLPEAEYQVRPLARLEPEVRTQVWEAAVIEAGGAQPSFSVVKEVAERISPAAPANPEPVRAVRHLPQADEPNDAPVMPEAAVVSQSVYAIVGQIKSELDVKQIGQLLSEFPWEMLLIAACAAFKATPDADANLAKKMTESQWAKAINRQVVVGAFVEASA